MRLRSFKALLLIAYVALLAACSKGGQLTLEPGAIKVKNKKGSPYVSVVQGAHANLTSTGGVKGWVSVQTISAADLSSGSHNMILNKPSPLTSQ